MTTNPLTYATAPHPYTPAVATSDLVFVSGRLGVNDGEFVEGVAAQTTQAIANADRELSAHGLDLTHLVKATIFLADIDDLQIMNQAYTSAIPEPRPARSCVAVTGLPFGGQVEIELIASRSKCRPTPRTHPYVQLAAAACQPRHRQRRGNEPGPRVPEPPTGFEPATSSFG